MNAEKLVSLIISNTASQYSEEWKPDKVYTKDELIELAESMFVQPISEEEIEKLLGRDQPWSLVDVLKKLVEATSILLHEKDYDGHGWEEIEICHNRGKEIISLLNSKDGLLSRGVAKESEWISVEDRLPTKEDADKYGEVLIWIGAEGEECWHRASYSAMGLKSTPPTIKIWHPLPKPPTVK